MKTLVSIAVAGLATFGVTSPATAFHFEPENTAFTANGAITVTAGAVSLPCTANVGGNTAADGTARIRSVTFSGVSCAALTASNLPWKLSAANLTTVKLHHVTVSAVVLGICGPGNVTAALDAGGVITIAGANLPGVVPCTISGVLQTHPHLRIHS